MARDELPPGKPRLLTLRFLGEMEALRDGALLPLPQSKKTRALLAYLALAGRAKRRERLCELFWEMPDDPRGALRWSLSKLRALVDEPGRSRIVADRESVRFEPLEADVDVLTAREQLGAGIDSLATERLAAIAALFRGTLLDGLDLPRCPEFQAWCVAAREDARLQHAALLRALIERLQAQPEAVLPHARTLAQIDPFDEAARHELGRALRATGRHDEAARLAESAAPDIGLGRATAESRPAAANAGRHAIAQTIRFCRGADGTRIAYATAGAGPPLVRPGHWLSHLEYDWDSPIWRHLLEELAQDHQLVRYDARGNGLSDWDVQDLSFPALVDDLEAVVDAIGAERFALLGISQGCAISVAYAVRHPERVSHLVLYGGYVRGWAQRGVPEEIERRRAMSTLMQHGWGQDNPAFRQLFTTLFVPEATIEQMAWFNELQRRSTSPQNAVRLQDAASQIDVTDLLPRVRVPTLVLHCRGDAVAPFAQGVEFAASIAGAPFVPLDSRNHLFLEHEPARTRFLAEVRAFLARPN
jgi:DNA-binding SARP family transcriptional activator/pimeloyl-ACP methyl ester carboxylesterase